MKRVLLISSAIDNHILRLIRNVKKYDKENLIEFDILDIYGNNECLSPYVKNLYFKSRHFHNALYNVPVLSRILNMYDAKWTVRDIKHEYDLINIQFFTPFSINAWSELKKIGKDILVTLWGSDVYRIDDKTKEKYKLFFRNVNKFTCLKNKFRDYLQDTFCIPDSKFVDLGYGSEILDLLISYSESKEIAKQKMGYPGCFMITCGYNRSPQQNHEKIIDAIVQVKESLPDNLLLVLPFAYGNAPADYQQGLIDKLKRSNLNYVFIERYLSNEENVQLRYATDYFIHFQKSDAASATVQEHILAGSVVFNAEWLRYKEIEQLGGTPYISFTDEKDLAEHIKSVAAGKESINVLEKCKDYIKHNSWSERGLEWYQYYKDI